MGKRTSERDKQIVKIAKRKLAEFRTWGRLAGYFEGNPLDGFRERTDILGSPRTNKPFSNHLSGQERKQVALEEVKAILEAVEQIEHPNKTGKHEDKTRLLKEIVRRRFLRYGESETMLTICYDLGISEYKVWEYLKIACLEFAKHYRQGVLIDYVDELEG